MDAAIFWPQDLPVMRRYAVAPLPWRSAVESADVGVRHIVLHLRDIRFSRELLTMKY